MAIYNLRGAVERIMNTKSDSPVVVVATGMPNQFDVFFYGTVYGHAVAEDKPEGFIGIFHRGMPEQKVALKLKAALDKI